MILMEPTQQVCNQYCMLTRWIYLPTLRVVPGEIVVATHKSTESSSWPIVTTLPLFHAAWDQDCMTFGKYNRPCLSVRFVSAVQLVLH